MPIDRSLPPNLAAELKDLRARLDAIERSPRLPSSSIGSGGLRVVDGGSFRLVDPTTGRTVLYAGPRNTVDGAQQMVFLVTRDDGTPALQLADNGSIPGHPHQQALQWYDRQGNTTFSDDTVGGSGIARPWLSMGQWVDNVAPGFNATPTASTTFVTQQVAVAYRQHPRYIVDALVYSDAADTTGEVGLFAPDGSQVGSTMPVPANGTTYARLGPLPWPSWQFGDGGYFTLCARVTAGTGHVGVRGTGFWGTQS